MAARFDVACTCCGEKISEAQPTSKTMDDQYLLLSSFASLLLVDWFICDVYSYEYSPSSPPYRLDLSSTLASSSPITSTDWHE